MTAIESSSDPQGTPGEDPRGAVRELPTDASGGPTDSSQKSILFVCLGNICRSPAAEALLAALIVERSLESRIRVDSAGTSGYHLGEPADRRMRAAASRRGLKLTSRSRMVNRRDFSEFDLIIAMDRSNYRELLALAGSREHKVKLLSDFLDESWPRDVPDPYFGGQDGFDQVLDMLQAACPRVLEAVLTEH